MKETATNSVFNPNNDPNIIHKLTLLAGFYVVANEMFGRKVHGGHVPILYPQRPSRDAVIFDNTSHSVAIESTTDPVTIVLILLILY